MRSFLATTVFDDNSTEKNRALSISFSWVDKLLVTGVQDGVDLFNSTLWPLSMVAAVLGAFFLGLRRQGFRLILMA